MLAVLLLRLVASPSSLWPSLASACVDAAILGGVSIALGVPPFRARPLRFLGDAALVAFMLAYGTLIFWHAWFLDIGGEYRFSLVGITIGTARFFASQIVPVQAWAAFLAFWVLVLSIRRWTLCDRVFPIHVFRWSRAGRLALGISLMFLGFGAAGTAAVRHPLSQTLRDAAARTRSRTIRASDAGIPVEHLNLRRTEPWPISSRFQRVLVFVMESVPREDFDAKVSELPPGGFFHDVARFATKYEGYYTVNQESRTARMAMLHSLMIPYEAYVSDWTDKFRWIYDRGGMVDVLNAGGWRTAMAIPLVDPPWDLRGLPWKSTIGIAEDDIGREGYTCLAPTEYDRGCEDRILLEKIDSLLDEPGPVFLFQHFLFGHTDKWEATTGIDRVQYYEGYLGEVLAILRRKELLPGTLIVVTSDHGPRTPRALSKVESYEVPLWFVHPSFPAEIRSGHFTNTEFRDLVLEAMRDGTPPEPRQRPWIMAMGPSTRAMFMCASDDGQFAFLRIVKEGRATVMRASPDDRGHWVPCVSTFFRYRSRFDALRDGN